MSEFRTIESYAGNVAFSCRNGELNADDIVSALQCVYAKEIDVAELVSRINKRSGKYIFRADVRETNYEAIKWGCVRTYQATARLYEGDDCTPPIKTLTLTFEVKYRIE